MTAKELATELLKYPEFDVQFQISRKDNSEWGIAYRTFDIEIADIGHSDKVINLTGEED